MQMTDQRIVFFRGMSDGSYVLSRDDKDMDRSLRVDIGECIALVVLINGFGWNASIEDLAKDAAHVESLSSAVPRCRISTTLGEGSGCEPLLP